MGKEIKIGLGVIAILFIAFVAVLTMRLFDKHDEVVAVAKADGVGEDAKDVSVPKALPVPSPKPVATRLEEQKPAGKKRESGGLRLSIPSQDENSRSTIGDPSVQSLPQMQQPAGWAKADDAGASTQSASGLLVLDPPDPPRPDAIASDPARQYQSNRLSTQQTVYHNVSTTTRDSAAQRGYGGYRHDDGGQSRYAGQYAVTPPPPLAQGPIGGPRGDGTYEVQPNDNYWLISRKVYGDGAYFQALAEHNRREHPLPDRLRVGDVVSTPALAELVKDYPDYCPGAARRKTMEKRSNVMGVSAPYGGGNTYTVQNGDTLYDIARYELGDASRWVEILELNRRVLQDDFDYLTPGMSLTMPRESSDSITQRPLPYQQQQSGGALLR